MGFQEAYDHLKVFGFEERIKTPEAPTPTVEAAARAVGCEPEHIAKTLAFYGEEGPILVVAAGDAKVDNRRFREEFGCKPKMISFEEVEDLVGHAPGGVCPFGVKEGVRVTLDVSLRRFSYVYPAAGDDHSAVKLTPEELYECAEALSWVDVCKAWRDA